LVRIELITVGKNKEHWVDEGIRHYQELLKRFVELKIVYLKEEKIIEGENEKEVKKIEGGRILKNLNKNAFSIALDQKGKMISSEELAKFFQTKMNQGKSEFAFVVGGALGLEENVLRECDAIFSFSKMTFTHQLSRLILLEQVYRAFSILKGTKYHK
jgi:23S rRNA (pseudouridine1915-N3)-methyltransferase